MAKAVLVMDMPENCGDCEFSDIDWGKGMCSIENKSTRLLGRRPDWCPLIQEPERKDPYANFNGTIDTGTYQYAEAIGWNTCLDALEGK